VEKLQEHLDLVKKNPTTMVISSSTEREKEDLSKLGREWYGNASLFKEKIMLIQNLV